MPNTNVYPHAILSVDASINKMASSKNGLSDRESSQRLVRFGLNELETDRLSWTRILFTQFRSPFIYLLVAAAGLAFVLKEYLDGGMIMLFVTINALLGFFQEYHSARTIELLKKYTSAKAVVRRGGQTITVLSSRLVPGDIVLLGPGTVVPADVRLIQTKNLIIDESILSGESQTVTKKNTPLNVLPHSFFDSDNLGFTGTTVISGEGEGVVVSTGQNTVIGHISRLSNQTVRVSTFEKNIHHFSRFILRMIVLTLLLVFGANIFIRGVSSDVGELIIFSIALAVSVIPEALPVVITFSLSRGARRLAKEKVVVKRLTAIEDLGSIEVLCTDKTGTITENRLTVEEYQPVSPQLQLYACLSAMVLKTNALQISNSFDQALIGAITSAEKKVTHSYQLVEETPFDPQKRFSTVVVKNPDGVKAIVRGAPETVLKMCQLKFSEKKRLLQWASVRGQNGSRVLAVAVRHTKPGTTNMTSGKLRMLGLISFSDPLKKSSLPALHKARAMGVAVKILTGDQPEVAGHIAWKAGIISRPVEVITGEQFDRFSNEQKKRTVTQYSVFARVTPQQKYDIIKLLQEKHEVGFLGEGINDAPALKIANVGLVVQGASDVARESADIILLHKSLRVIIDGIQEGRLVFANTTKYIKTTLASNFGNFYAMAIVSLLINILPMLPLQVLLLNLLSDFPMIAIASDSVDPAELKSPRSYRVREIAAVSTVLGLVSSVFDFLMFAVLYRISASIFQAGWFVGSVLTELAFIYSCRSRLPFWKAKIPSRGLLFFSILAALVTIILPQTNPGQEVFRLVRLQGWHLGLILAIVWVYFSVTEAVKLMYYRFAGEKSIT